MKVRASRDDAMVRLMIKGNPVYVVSREPVEVDMEDQNVREQVELMLKLGWLLPVEEESAQSTQPEDESARSAGDANIQTSQRRTFTRRSSQ
jgi:hypothetical protein